MSGRKKSKQQKKPTQAERLDTMEETLQLILARMPTAQQQDRPVNEDDSRQQPPPAMASQQNTQDHGGHSQAMNTSARQSRARNRAIYVSGEEETACTDKNYTPKNRQRARTSTPHRPHISPRSSSADTTPTHRDRESQRRAGMYSPADILDSPVAKAKARQLLELLDPSASDKGKEFDPFYNRPVRYPMPRLYINNTAQKIVKQYRHYDDLTLPQFIEGFARMIDNEKSIRKKSLMLMHLSEIGVMLQDFPWDLVREWTNAVLGAIGQGTYEWSDGHKIEKEKVTKMMTASASSRLAGFQQGKNACLAFNATKCPEIGSHGHNALHVCSFCLTAFSAEHDHPVLACNKRTTYRRGRDRGEYVRGDKAYRSDQNDSQYVQRQQDTNQQQAGRGKPSYNSYAQSTQYRPPYQYQNRQNWSQPPPEIKNWSQPAL